MRRGVVGTSRSRRSRASRQAIDRVTFFGSPLPAAGAAGGLGGMNSACGRNLGTLRGTETSPSSPVAGAMGGEATGADCIARGPLAYAVFDWVRSTRCSFRDASGRSGARRRMAASGGQEVLSALGRIEPRGLDRRRFGRTALHGVARAALQDRCEHLRGRVLCSSGFSAGEGSQGVSGWSHLTCGGRRAC